MVGIEMLRNIINKSTVVKITSYYLILLNIIAV
jgi:hypothetical protein